MRILIAQSGGPTSVINASLTEAIKRSRELGHEMLGGLYGIEGILQSKIISMNQSDKELERISHTPGAFLGSCRHVLPGSQSEEYDTLFDLFHSQNIGAFLYIGGNDSMDSVAKIYKEAERRHFPILVNGIPKTIDNDLVETDHCPGFASSARFLNMIASEFVIDSSSYSTPPICVVETMGRDTGWLAASLKFSEHLVKGLKVLTYLPEFPVSVEEMLDEVAEYKSQPLLVSVSEGIKDKQGNYLQSIQISDSFGHPKLGGSGEYVASLLKKIRKVKFVNPSFTQRSASHAISPIDFEEAKMVASKAVDLVEKGKSGLFVGIERIEKNYLSSTKIVEVEKVANRIKYVPKAFLENDMKAFLEYIDPLIGEMNPFSKFPRSFNFTQ